MDTINVEYAAVKLIEACVKAAYGEDASIDPAPHLNQMQVSYHVWQNGELICYFTVNGSFVTIWVWSPYYNRHFSSPESPDWHRNHELSKRFNLADPDNERIVRHFSSLRCNCGTRNQRGEGQRLHQD